MPTNTLRRNKSMLQELLLVAWMALIRRSTIAATSESFLLPRGLHYYMKSGHLKIQSVGWFGSFSSTTIVLTIPQHPSQGRKVMSSKPKLLTPKVFQNRKDVLNGVRIPGWLEAFSSTTLEIFGKGTLDKNVISIFRVPIESTLPIGHCVYVISHFFQI